jgi:nicotinate-nucleotide adenylyltransferase
MKRIGFIGGSFNPVHSGHIVFARHFIAQLHLNKCIFIPAAASPFKAEKIIASPVHRVQMLQFAIHGQPDMEYSSIELDRGGISYTIDTVHALEKAYPGDLLYMLIGQDQASLFHLWKEWQLIAQKVQLCIVRRHEPECDEAAVNTLLESIHCKAVWLDAPQIDISSTQIRSYRRDGQSISGLVPQRVEQYILENRLYEQD